MSDVRPRTPPESSTPEERLEWLRFVVQGGDDNLKPALLDWMHEVERQVAALRARVNELPIRKRIVW